MEMAPPQDAHTQLTAAVDRLDVQVTRENVLQARTILLGEAERLLGLLRLTTFGSGVGLCGGDPVSVDARDAFNERIGSLTQHCWRYAQELEAAANRLGETARSYGWSEEEIARSFSSGGPHPGR